MPIPEGGQSNNPVPKGDAYVSSYLDTIEKKRLNLRDTAGNIDNKKLEVIEKFTEALDKNPAFIALSLRSKGFGEKKFLRQKRDPMVWAAVLYDSATPGFNVNSFYREVMDIRDRFLKHRRLSLSVMATWVPDSQYDLNALRGITDVEYSDVVPKILAYLCYTTTGDRIGPFRDIAKGRLGAMKPSARESLLRATLDQIIYDSEQELNNFQNTTGNHLWNDQKKRHLSEGREFWKKRIENIFGVKFK